MITERLLSRIYLACLRGKDAFFAVQVDLWAPEGVKSSSSYISRTLVQNAMTLAMVAKLSLKTWAVPQFSEFTESSSFYMAKHMCG